MLTPVQEIMLKVLLGPEDSTAWKRLKALESTRAWRKRNPETVAADNRAWRKKNPEKVAANNRAGYPRDPEKAAERSRAWFKRNREKAYERVRAWQKRNPERILAAAAKWAKRRRDTDPGYRILKALRHRIWKVLKAGTKASGTRHLLGCTIPELRAHLEARFVPGMTWENYGPVWHVDHKRPCASFDLLDPAQQRECFHFSNLQPLFAEDNLRKGDTWP